MPSLPPSRHVRARHTLVVYARSRRDGHYTGGAVSVNVRRDPLIRIDAPANGEAVRQPFTVQGWAADLTSPSGTGVDMVRIVAVRPDGTRIALGNASYGSSRQDVAKYFEQTALAPGFGMTVTGLPAGRYTLVAEARYTATGLFERSASVDVSVAGTSPIGVLDTPIEGATVAGTVLVSGWALSDAGIARVAVYRDPMGNETQQVWIGDATFVEGVRPDVAAAFPGYP
ncbi:MAG: Ig-like domain-containing protein, partial [Acidobacteriota bacterium]|nr:Ig-like domain-containing protein [Acidobacteriota bacterium]